MGVDGHVNQTEAVAFDFSLTCNFNLIFFFISCLTIYAAELV